MDIDLPVDSAADAASDWRSRSGSASVPLTQSDVLMSQMEETSLS